MKKVLALFCFVFLWCNGQSATCEKRVARELQPVESLERQLDGFFGTHQDFFIAQRKEWVEIATDMETRNTYEILDIDKNRLGVALEKKGGFWSFLLRQALKTHRPLEVVVLSRDNEELLRIKRPFYWFFSSMRISSGEQELGTVQQRFSLLRRKYTMCSPGGAVMGNISGPLWRPWTFPVFDLGGREIGKISKKWSGLLQEAVSDADTFSIRFPGNWRASEKALILASAFSVDLDCFEK